MIRWNYIRYPVCNCLQGIVKNTTLRLNGAFEAAFTSEPSGIPVMVKMCVPITVGVVGILEDRHCRDQMRAELISYRPLCAL